MGYGAYIGRVGALAVALGIGVAVAYSPGVASAEPSDSGSTSSGSSSDSSSGSQGSTSGSSSSTSDPAPPGSTSDPASASGVTSDPVVSSSTESTPDRHSSPKVVFDNTGGAHTSKKSGGQTPPPGGADTSHKPAGEIAVADDPPSGSTTAGPAGTTAPEPESTTAEPKAPAAATAELGGATTGSERPQRSSHTPQEPPDAPVGAPRVDATTVTATADPAPSRPPVIERAGAVVDQPAAQPPATALSTLTSPVSPAAVMATEVISAAPEKLTPPRPTVSKVVLGGLALAGLDRLPTDSPTAPIDPPIGLTLAAWGTRPRQSGQAVTEQAHSMAYNPMLTSQSVDTTAAGQTLAAEPMTAAATTTSTTTFAQVKAAAPQTQQSGRARPGGDTQAPTVNITGLAAGATVSGTVTVSATASDNVGVLGVQFTLDGTTNLGAEDTSAPYGPVSWHTTTVANGSHTLTAVARDAADNKKTSAVTVTVDNAAPAVSLIGPGNGATVSGTVTLGATASDNVGVVGVRFFVDGNQLGAEDPSAPYGPVSWNTTTVTNGSQHALKAVARDAAGNSTTSTATVTVANATPQQIPVTITAITVDTYPSAVAISGNNAYVYGGDVIWTINTISKTVTDKTALYNDPPAITPEGRKYVPNPNLYYQGNAPYDSVDVINTATNKVIKNIPIPICYDCAYANPSGPRDVVMSPDRNRVYVSEDYYVETGINTTVVTMIDTATDTVRGYVPTSPLSDMEIAPNGTIYAASAEYPYVTVYNADMSQIGAFSLTSLGYYFWSPSTALALDGAGTRAYVVVQDYGVGQHVSVIDTGPASPTRNTEIAVITERTTALSPDGSRRYVAQPDGKTVVVYDTASNTTIGSFVTDQNAGPSARSIAVAADGTLYITDMDDNKVYVVAVG
jgi:hypothetical protein